MKFRNIWFDGGSFLLAIIALSSTLAPLIENLRDNKAKSNDYVIAAAGILAAILFVWLSVRIGKNRKLIRDTSRWLPENATHDNRK